MVTFTPQPIYARKRKSRNKLNMRMDGPGPHSRSGSLGKREACWKSIPDSSVVQLIALISIHTEQPKYDFNEAMLTRFVAYLQF